MVVALPAVDGGQAEIGAVDDFLRQAPARAEEQQKAAALFLHQPPQLAVAGEIPLQPRAGGDEAGSRAVAFGYVGHRVLQIGDSVGKI